MAKGVEDTAFYRYVRLLALNDVGGDPGRFGHRRSTTSTPRNAERARALPAQPARHRRRTTPSARATCARGSARWPAMAGRVGASACARWRELNAPLRARRRARRRRGVPDLPDARRAPGRSSPSGSRPTSRRRCARPSATRTGSSRTSDYEARGQGASRARCYDHRRVPRRLRAVRRARSPRRASAPRSASCCSSSPSPGVPDIYQGDELLGALARRPRQPPPGRLGPRAARRSPRCAAAPRRRRETIKLRLIGRALDAARAAAGGVRRRLRAARRRARACARSCAAARCSSCVAGARRRRAARRSRRPRGAAGATCSPARERELRRRGRVADLARRARRWRCSSARRAGPSSRCRRAPPDRALSAGRPASISSTRSSPRCASAAAGRPPPAAASPSRRATCGGRDRRATAGAAGVHDPGTEPGPRPLEVDRRRAQRRAMAGGRLQLRLEVEVVERRDLGRDGAVVPGEEAGDHAERPVGRQRDAHQAARRSQPGHLVRPPAELGDLRRR